MDATADGMVDFYVMPLTHAVSTRREWLVCKDSASNCVGIQDGIEAATAQAIRMAEYTTASGRIAQVHCRDHDEAQWRKIWHSPEKRTR